MEKTASKAKRKTPTELRGDQLKRTSFLDQARESLRPCKSTERDNVSTKVSDDANIKTHQRCSQSLFRSVTELSTKSEEFSCLKDIDMNKALKGFATCEPLPSDITSKTERSETASLRRGNFHVYGQKIPLDLSMKTCVRLVSSSPLTWLHKSIIGSTYIGMPQVNSMMLHSWVYPQSILPQFIISSLVNSGEETDFFRKRQLAWEDAFRSLYFMFRKNHCKIFYLCTSQFIAMFMSTASRRKDSCNAYITQSTRTLRDKLKDNDISYSMPLCKTEIEDQTSVEDLAELTEIENHNLGQIHRRLSSFSSIDNTPESCLAFDGNDSVHGLYDLLLNYKSLLGFLDNAADDVPLLYSPVPFLNAAVSSPEIKLTSCCTVEIKGEYFLPPWIISNLCANVVANEQNFEASFVTEPTSISLNIGLPQVLEKTDDASGIIGAVICPQLRLGYLKSLKYCNKSYTVSLDLY